MAGFQAPTASGSWGDTIRLWDVDTGTLKNTLTGHQAPVHSVSFSPDGQMLASEGRDTIYVWDTSIFVPDPEKLRVDVNGDGVINIQDLIRVAVRIGQDVPVGEDPADVNGDGVINIQDLVQVVGAVCN